VGGRGAGQAASRPRPPLQATGRSKQRPYREQRRRARPEAARCAFCYRTSMTSLPESRRGELGYAALCDLVRARVARGELRPGERLKPVRAWAAELGVNVNTVARAYATLAHDGVVVTQPGGGTRVASVPD